mmetsp:Transcript_16621/g.30874  ORF Transcript_16621/g.30874 Transcript_16621/m.30874 type:complete len:104 (-) Transcript_16621:778-1089(-)
MPLLDLSGRVPEHGASRANMMLPGCVPVGLQIPVCLMWHFAKFGDGAMRDQGVVIACVIFLEMLVWRESISHEVMRTAMTYHKYGSARRRCGKSCIYCSPVAL